MDQKIRSPFTGRHMTAIMIAFFGTVIAVNLLMAVLATGTFGGTVVDNSYVASQRFNGWLAQARAQEAMGWQEQTGLDGERRILLSLSHVSAGENGGPVSGATVTAIARHPLGRAPERTIGFGEISTGRYRAGQALPAGRWIVHFSIRSAAGEKRLIRELQ